jgi:hypothetical protein
MFQTGSPFPEALDAYREQLAAFRRKFGREMGPDDPFFFDPDADTPQFRNPSYAAHAINAIAAMMGQAGVDAAAIYAFTRTGGLFPTETRRLSRDEELEWNAAVNEYRAAGAHAAAIAEPAAGIEGIPGGRSVGPPSRT